ncbi:hypothetical protein IJI76_02375 [Candidatus Saccharibacteria bacterium]|nr:hypothetical protein [Candidatus Saccharibacteria bacterium]
MNSTNKTTNETQAVPEVPITGSTPLDYVGKDVIIMFAIFVICALSVIMLALKGVSKDEA